MRQSDSVSEELDTENVQCALDFENTMNELETQLYYRHLPPKEVALRVMEAACKFYDADWCGLIQVDLDLGLWKPLWWHNECQEDKTTIRNERSVRSTAEAENRLPLNIHGKSLLAGNAYCGHCGAKLELTSSRKWRKMADGSLDDTLRIRYTCYGKLRKQTNCTGQTGYTVHILDEIIDKAVRQIFSKMRGIPKEQIVTKRYEKENAERKNHLQDLQTQRNKAEKDLFALKTEVLACIKGESVLPRETLAEMITAQEEKLTELENLCEAASEELEKTAELMDKVSRLYDELISYADLYDSANFEAKKMIVNQLIRRVDVYRGYQINISFNFDLTPYIEGE